MLWLLVVAGAALLLLKRRDGGLDRAEELFGERHARGEISDGEFEEHSSKLDR